ncbi:MAG: dephospho-CoA kinase [Pseudomonadota bacterium]
MKIIGLTGGIGCGKSAVSEDFEALGVPVIDADIIAHQLSEPGELGWQAITERWGSLFLDAEKRLDRPKLREAIFHDATIKTQLEDCLHPLIFNEVLAQTHHLDNLKIHSYIVWSIPLLLESSRYRDRVDRVLVIDAPVAVQIKRVLERGVSLKTIQQVLHHQMSRSVRQSLAEDLIINIGSKKTLSQIVKYLHNCYNAMK